MTGELQRLEDGIKEIRDKQIETLERLAAFEAKLQADKEMRQERNSALTKHIAKQDERITALEKWKWIGNGIASAVAFALSYVGVKFTSGAG